MTDIVTRLLALADDYRDGSNPDRTTQCRQALQYELIKLFTPLSNEEIESVNNVWINQLDYEVFEIHQPSVYEFARAVENLHGIEKTK